jgi:GH15 family glucan-1,4-alpha-glucosidase
MDDFAAGLAVERRNVLRQNETPKRKIADHGVIGNLSTMALVATDGAIDFLCWPRFDSPSIFAAILDDAVGGVFELAPEIADARVVQTYLPDSNVLITRWLGAEASAEITDLMTGSVELGKGAPRLIRRVRVTRGEAVFKLRCDPRADYARDTPVSVVRPGEAIFEAANGLTLRLRGTATFVTAKSGVTAGFGLTKDHSVTFVLDEAGDPDLSAEELDALIDETTHCWQAWAARSTYTGRWRDVVTRSALALKLMTSREHGSIMAAATFGLPETEGGPRNWDYRATWIRDASFTVYGLMRLGYQEEATAFTRWAAERAADCPHGLLQVMYAEDGGPVREEVSLDHLAGYGGARPVRIGNAAVGQIQLDIFGALLDSIYISNKYGEAISHDDWQGVCRVVDHVCENWQKPDAGIWESRTDVSEHLHSRLMCWVAVDRALRLATKRSLNAPFAKWTAVRNEINDDIWSNFWSDEAGHFVRSKGSAELDGAILMMPLVRFVASTDPKWLKTLDAIGERLTDDGMVMRYDGKDAELRKEGSFAACAFWYVECLARAGRIEKARENFERLVAYGNHLKLYSEEFSPRGDLVGNFPQALTHLALISAAFYLDRAIDGHRGQAWRV